MNLGSGDGGGSDYSASSYVSGRRVRWTALASAMLGAGVYANLIGVLGILGDIETAISRSLGGVETFLAGTISATFASGAAAIDSAWWSYWLAARGTFGPLAWHVTLIFTFAGLWLLLMGVQRLVG